MLAHRPAPDVFSSEALANLRLHLGHKVDLERVAEVRGL
jgi:hypothetical protein